MRNTQSNHTVYSVIFLLLCCCNCFHRHCEAVQLKPNEDLNVDRYTSDVTKRQNFCDLQASVDADETELRNALSGKHLNIAIIAGKYVNASADTGIFNDTEYLGISVKIFDEIASRGNFTWKDSYAFYDGPGTDEMGENIDWTELLLWSIETFDVSVDWWIPNAKRIAAGTTFPKGWLDASMIIVTKNEYASDDPQSQFSFFNWTRPFTTSVWATIFGTLVITAIVSLYVEGLNGIYAPKKGNVFSVFFSYLHHCLLVVTGHIDHLPRSHPGQLLSFSIAFFAMLLLASYTANLASFLVIEKAAANTLVNTVNDIVTSGKSICVESGAATQAAIERNYKNKDKLLLVERESDNDSLKGLRDGDCDFAVMPAGNFDSAKIQEAINGDCNLERVGQTFRVAEAGYATYSDAGVLCTSMVRDVLNVHMQDMHDDGWIEQEWQSYLGNNTDIDDPKCFDDTSSVTRDEETLDLINLGGVFLFHAGIVYIAILLFILEKQIKKRKIFMSDGVEKSMVTKKEMPLTVTDIRKKHSNQSHETEIAQIKDDLDQVTQKVDHLTFLLTRALQNGIPKDSFNDDYVDA